MIRNYIKLALRNLLKYKGYSVINIIGLSLGMAITLIILLYILDELNYDKYHSDADSIYRVTREWFNEDGSTSLELARVAPPVGYYLENDYPEFIEEMVRVFGGHEILFRRGENTFLEKRSYFAEPSFFSIFTHTLEQGDPATALNEPLSIILSRSTAVRYFGEQDPMGQIIEFDSPISDDVVPMKVTGIMQDPPEDSHLKMDILASFATLENFLTPEFMRTNWSNNSYLTYLKLAPNVDVADLQAEVDDFLDRHLSEEYRNYTERTGLKPSQTNTLHFQKLTDIHLHSHLSAEAEQGGDYSNVIIFSLIAFAVILIACINFMNLSTARAGRRAREIGMRKVIGANRGQVQLQFLGESVFIAIIAMLIALVIVELSLPVFNEYLGKNLGIFKGDTLNILLMLAGVTLFTGIVSGSYPAFYLSSFKPIVVLKQSVGSKKGVWFRRVLVIFQFSVSIALIVAVAVIFLQMRYMKNRDLGYQTEQVLSIQADQQLFNKMGVFREELLKSPYVLNVSRSSLIPTDKLLNNSGGRTLGDDGSDKPLSFRLPSVDVDYHYLQTFGIELVAGRYFSEEYGTDDSAAFIINETASRKIGWEPAEAVGKPLMYGGKRGRVIGVVKDFHFESLHSEIQPVLFRISDNFVFRLSVSIVPDNHEATLAYIEEVFNRIRPGYPFTYHYLERVIDDQYSEERQQAMLIGLFSLLSVIIACLGLLGLASFTAEQRQKEMSIRKVFGASTGNIVGLLSSEFMKWVLLANAIAWPVAWFMMKRWLEGFAYSIDLGIWIFLISGLLAIIIALLTVLFQAFKASWTNPVDGLRYE